MDSSCTLEIHSIEAGYLLRIVGRGTMKESPTARDFATGAIEEGRNLIVDLNCCTFLDSTFLGCLVLLKKNADTERGTFHVHASVDQVAKLFGPIGLQNYLPFTEQSPKCRGEKVDLPITSLERKEFCRHLQETHGKLAELDGPNSGIFRAIGKQLESELGGTS